MSMTGKNQDINNKAWDAMLTHLAGLRREVWVTAFQLGRVACNHRGHNQRDRVRLQQMVEVGLVESRQRQGQPGIIEWRMIEGAPWRDHLREDR